jgi:CRISP-associated protein Cas1
MAELDLIKNLNRSNKFLFLEGYRINVRVDDGKLIIRNVDGSKQTFFPKRFPFNNIIIYGTRGSISFEAIRWLLKHNAQISVINWNGKLLTSILPQEAKQTKLKFKQYEAYKSQKRIEIAKKLIKAKIERTKDVLSWLKERYPTVNDRIDKIAFALSIVKTIQEIMNIEGRVADLYWKEVSKIFDKKFGFESRMFGKTKRPMGAVDPINALFNYGYALLEAECRKAINSVGLDTHVGFLHEVILGKEPLVYDLQEPFRWLIDVAVINALEKKMFDKKDFIRTENYNLKLRLSGARKLIKEVETQLNKKVFYRKNWYSWHYIILLKTQELAQYLLGKRRELKFDLPRLELKRIDNAKLREKILKFPYSKAKKLGISKGTLWYLKHNAMSDKPFKIYNKTNKKLIKIILE